MLAHYGVPDAIVAQQEDACACLACFCCRPQYPSLLGPLHRQGADACKLLGLLVPVLQSQTELAIREAETAAVLESVGRQVEALEERARAAQEEEVAAQARDEALDQREHQLEERAQALQLVSTARSRGGRACSFAGLVCLVGVKIWAWWVMQGAVSPYLEGCTNVALDAQSNCMRAGRDSLLVQAQCPTTWHM
jgi:hypothetical protein